MSNKLIIYTAIAVGGVVLYGVAAHFMEKQRAEAAAKEKKRKAMIAAAEQLLLPKKFAVSYIISKEGESGEFLCVQRPANDANLPNVWGLPAGMATAAAGGSEHPTDAEWTAAVEQSGVQKLGVALKVGAVLSEGQQPRAEYVLHMRQYAVEVIGGDTPEVPQPVEGVTQYQQWRWAATADLADAASKGSLCSRLYIDLQKEKKQ